MPLANLSSIFLADGAGPLAVFGCSRLIVDSVRLVLVPLSTCRLSKLHLLAPPDVQLGYLVSLTSASVLFSGSRMSRNFSRVTCFTYAVT